MDERRAAKRGKKRGSGPIWRRIRYAAALIAVIAAVSTFFKISDIQVEGNMIYSSEEIISASGLDTGSMLFFAGRRGAGKRIYAKLPFDSVIIYGICKKLSVMDINNLLFEHELPTLG